MGIIKIYLISFIILLLPVRAAVTQNTPYTPLFPINHCYHWLEEAGKGYLSTKYNYARNNDGDISFFTTAATSNGAVAGPGLYCAKSPVGSYSYGDRVIRLDFVDDIVILDASTGKKYCGVDGTFYKTQAECDKQAWDVKFYESGGKGSYAWYVIRNPQAIQQWSANSNQLESDLLLNKQFSNYAYSNHADQTIALMQSERSKYGEVVIRNFKARQDLIDILKDPKESAKFPPLSLIARLHQYSSRRKVNKPSFYRYFAKRALKDISLSYSDYKELIDTDIEIKTVFLDLVNEFVNKLNLSKVNAVASMLILNEYDSAKLTQSSVKKIWRGIFKSNGSLSQLASANFTTPVIQKEFFNLLPAHSEIKEMYPNNQLELLKLINKLVADNSHAKIVKPFINKILDNLAIKGPKNLTAAAKSLTSQYLPSKNFLKDFVKRQAQAKFKDNHPIYLGAFLEDEVSKLFDSHTLANYKKLLANLPLPVVDQPAHQLLNEYMSGKIKLPSFITANNFLKKLFYLSLAERSVLSSPTNTYRFLLSDYYEYFLSKLRAASSDVEKKTVQDNAESFFHSLLNELDGEVKMAYSYPLLQNAALFSSVGKAAGDLSYVNHPVEKYASVYLNSGNATFDKLLLDATRNAFDGSYLQYLAYTGLYQNVSSSKSLLKAFLDSLISSEFKRFRASNMYNNSNDEKTSWPNFMSNKHYQNGPNARALANFCGIASTLNKFSGKIFSFVSANVKSELEDLISEGQQLKCY